MCPVCNTERLHSAANFCPYVSNGTAGGVGISAAALPNKGRAVASTLRKDRDLSADLDAYKRLRREGLQPAGIKDAAKVEATAERREHVEMGKRGRVTDGQTGERRWIKDQSFNAFQNVFQHAPPNPAPKD